MSFRYFFKKLAFVILIILLGVIASSFFAKGSSKLTTSTYSFEFKKDGLSEIIEKDLSDQKGYYAIYIKNLATNEKYTLNEHARLPAASLYKLFLLAAVLKEEADGNLKLDDILSSDIQHLKDAYGDIDYGYEDQVGEVSFSVDEAMQRVGRISDNFASIMLAEKIGWDQVRGMTNLLEMKETNIESPITTSAEDIGVFFEKLYNQNVISPEISKKVTDYLALSQLNDRLPKYLPEGIKIVHKTGELSMVRNDAGIVYIEGKPYVIVLMSKDLEYEDDGAELLAKISQDVYGYFQTKTDKY